MSHNYEFRTSKPDMSIACTCGWVHPFDDDATMHDLVDVCRDHDFAAHGGEVARGM